MKKGLVLSMMVLTAIVCLAKETIEQEQCNAYMSTAANELSQAKRKNIKTLNLTTTPQMHCDNCEKKIKGNLRFEKGVKKIATSIPDQTVTIEYDADKTTPEKLIKAFTKFGYEARETEKHSEKSQ